MLEILGISRIIIPKESKYISMLLIYDNIAYKMKHNYLRLLNDGTINIGLSIKADSPKS